MCPRNTRKNWSRPRKRASAYRIVDGVVKGRLGSACWYTNLDYKQRHDELILYKRYTPEEYPHYDNYDAINVDKTVEIPRDWTGAMGVPITFLNKHSPEQFEIISANDIRLNDAVPFKTHGLIKDKDGSVNGKPKICAHRDTQEEGVMKAIYLGWAISYANPGFMFQWIRETPQRIEIIRNSQKTGTARA